MPININKNHWVLVVLVKPKDVLKPRNKSGGCCILHLDPVQPHQLENGSDVVAARDQQTDIHRTLLAWLNVEFDCGDGDIFTDTTYPLIYDFGPEGTLYVLCERIIDVTSSYFVLRF